uniref:Uncharacterized protein n=1 Tax=Plectus sambesii TaxID=2011161 RepID=A0A914X529_9BILA
MESQQQRHDSMSDDDDIVLTDVVMSRRSNIVKASPVADSTELHLPSALHTVPHPKESKLNLKKKHKPAGGPSQKKSALDSLFDDLLHKPNVDTDQKEATNKIQHYHKDDVWLTSELTFFSEMGHGIRTCFGPGIERITIGRFVRLEGGRTTKSFANGTKLQFTIKDAIKLYQILPSIYQLYKTQREEYKSLFDAMRTSRLAREGGAKKFPH